MNELQLKALLLDAITFLKFGNHLAPNWKQAKNRLCTMSGQKTNISTVNLIRLIGLTYQDNDKGEIFDQAMIKYDIADRIYN